MGYGEVVGNQSVHWKIDHEKGAKKPRVNQGQPNRPTGDDEVNADTQVMGRDPIDPASIGKGAKKGYFGVRLRFDSRQDAIDEAQRALAAVVDDGQGNYFLRFDVRAVPRAAPDNPPPAEIRIDW